MGNDSATKTNAGIGVTVIRKGQAKEPIKESTGKALGSLLFGMGLLAVVIQAFLWDVRLGVLIAGTICALMGLSLGAK